MGNFPLKFFVSVLGLHLWMNGGDGQAASHFAAATPQRPTRILFVCTGNFYRSRFAEAYLKFVAEKNALPLETFSRGIDVEPREGSVAPQVLAELEKRAIPAFYASGSPTQISRVDFELADVVIAMERREHQSRLEAMFPQMTAKIYYWNIRDGGVAPAISCASISRNVRLLVRQLLAPTEGKLRR